MDLTRAQVDSIAAQFGETVFKAHPSPGGSGLEDHRKVMSAKERGETLFFQSLLRCAGKLQQIPKSSPGVVEIGQKMPAA